MAKIELSITANYQPKWGIWEGIRELVCNGQDAERELGAKLSVFFLPSKGNAETEPGTLVIHNEGCTMPATALLLGHTTKAERTDTVGQFGEGFKIGTLALVRAGVKVVIRNGSEVWNAALETSEKFKGAEVLTFDIKGGRKGENRVRVEIQGVMQETWHSLRSRFLWLDAPASGQVVETPEGSLLLEERHKGMVYVKGVFIRQVKIEYGYNLSHGGLNRDRDLLDHYELQWKTKDIWQHAITKRPDLVEPFFKLIESDKDDARGVNEYTASHISPEAKQALASNFKKSYGDAVPVSSLSESKELETFGRRGVVVPKAMKIILASEIDTLEKIKASAKDEITRRYAWQELSEEQQRTLTRAMSFITWARPEYTFDMVNVVDFRDDDQRGLFAGGEINIASRELASVRDTLRVLVHEFAHFGGADGDHSHVHTSEELWADISARMLHLIDNGFQHGTTTLVVPPGMEAK
jgi:hypothetical protein